MGTARTFPSTSPVPGAPNLSAEPLALRVWEQSRSRGLAAGLGAVVSPVGERAGSGPKQFTLPSPAAGAVIVIDWLCCSRHFVFFQLSIACPLI